MEKIPLEIIGLSSSHSQIGHYALVLGEKNGNRRLPIIIGGAEAQAIALELENIKTNRPMTHDLIFNLAKHFEIDLLEVVITELNEGIFYARLVMEALGEIHEIDSRPSDAVAIGVRFQVPLFCLESVLSEAGIIIDDEQGAASYADEEGEFSLSELEKEDPEPEEALTTPSFTMDTSSDRLSTLKKKLDEALAGEDYEAAAKIRDEIQRLGGDI